MTQIGNSKRSTKDEPIYIDTSTPLTTRQTTQALINDIFKIVRSTQWPYKTHRELYHLRDQAFSVVFIIGGLRASETMRGPGHTSGYKLNKNTNKKELVQYVPNSYPLKFKQIKSYPERILLLNCQTVKRGNLRPEIVFPKKGALGDLTEILDKWINTLIDLGAEPNDYLFPRGVNNGLGLDLHTPLSTKRAWAIIYETTGKFPHWYRAVCETLYGRVIFRNNAYMLKERMGLKTLEATVTYVQSSFKEQERNAEKL